MAKLLHVAYAILVSGKPFDAEYARKKAKPMAEERQLARAKPTPPITSSQLTVTPDSAAPVSRKEAQNRRLAGKKQAAAGVPRLRDQSPKGIADAPQEHDPTALLSAKG
jgi:hypothetical protein